MWDVLQTLILGPLELIFEVLYAFACQLTGDPGFSIVVLSLAMNFLVLPLYRQADAMQEQQRQTEMKLRPYVNHIKKTFTGDERFMMLQTLYRQNHYKPTDVLKGSVSLLLEVPFFMAAYNFLSGLELLQGYSFGPIGDLGQPDGLLVLGGITINLLPVLMTAINLISGAIYTKGLPLRSKIQLYGMALLFLILLYDSPAGLVFYWTLNNVFSLGKNLLGKVKNKEKLLNLSKWCLHIVMSIAGLAGMVYILFFGPLTTLSLQILIAVGLLPLQLPLLLRFRKPRLAEQSEPHPWAFWGGALFLALFTGLYIPAAVVGASPGEFVTGASGRSPLLAVGSSLLLALGTFVLWYGIFYGLATPKGKCRMELTVWILSLMAVVDFLFFGTKYGNMSANLRYDSTPVISMQELILNILLWAVLGTLAWLLFKKKKNAIKGVYITACLAAAVMSGVHMVQIHQVAGETMEHIQAESEEMPGFTLSTTGKNVVVVMMDRAISSYLPYVMEEEPQLQQQFAGFTYYPNTISFGGSTNFGAPALFGGYEYTPAELNKRDGEKLVDKHDEALKVMPVLFDRAGYETTVCDPSYAGYQWVPDLSIYKDYPDIHTYLTLGKFTSPLDTAKEQALLHRNLFCYGVFRSAPVVLHAPLYAEGTYNKLGDTSGQICMDISTANGISPTFRNAYQVLSHFGDMTSVTQEPVNTFMMISNDTAHSPAMLQKPGYEPRQRVDNREYDQDHRKLYEQGGLHMDTVFQVKHYHANAAALVQMGKWMDDLREKGVYDNTRIILVADHGYYTGQREDMLLEGEDLMRFNPLLMVKDFGSQNFTVDHRFMTNGDVPTLAFRNLIENPVNPFTGNPITDAPKYEGEQLIIRSDEWDTSINNGNTFMDSKWLSVKENLFEKNCWKFID